MALMGQHQLLAMELSALELRVQRKGPRLPETLSPVSSTRLLSEPHPQSPAGWLLQ